MITQNLLGLERMRVLAYNTAKLLERGPRPSQKTAMFDADPSLSQTSSVVGLGFELTLTGVYLSTILQATAT